jgi:hypothetical protein
MCHPLLAGVYSSPVTSGSYCTLQFIACVVDIRGVSKTFGEWYQKTNKTEDTVTGWVFLPWIGEEVISCIAATTGY